MEQKVFVGDKWGELRVLEVYPYKSSYRCKCRCEICGNIVVFTQSELCGTKRKTSCGCAKGMRIRGNPTLVKLLKTKAVLDNRTDEERREIMNKRFYK